MALRVIVQVTGDQVELVKATHVEMPAPGDPGLTERPEDGMYVELRDAGNEPLFRRSVSSSLERGVEVFSADGVPRRIDVGERTQTLMLVLPDDVKPRSLAFLRAGRHRAAHGRAIQSDAADGPSELASFDLDGVLDR